MLRRVWNVPVLTCACHGLFSDKSESRRIQRGAGKPTPVWTEANCKRFDDRVPDSPASGVGDQVVMASHALKDM